MKFNDSPQGLYPVSTFFLGASQDVDAVDGVYFEGDSVIEGFVHFAMFTVADNQGS